MRILFADDDAILRDYIRSAISEDCIHKVDVASTVDESIKLIEKNKYDKIVVDLRFENEKLNGFDIVQKALEQEVKERIIFTSVSNQMDVLGKGATAAFRKPLSIKKIAQFLLTSDYEILKEGEVF